MGNIEKKVRVRYRHNQGTGSKFVNVKIDENEFRKCGSDFKKQEAFLIPHVKIQFPNEFKGVEIESIGWA